MEDGGDLDVWPIIGKRDPVGSLFHPSPSQAGKRGVRMRPIEERSPDIRNALPSAHDRRSKVAGTFRPNFGFLVRCEANELRIGESGAEDHAARARIPASIRSIAASSLARASPKGTPGDVRLSRSLSSIMASNSASVGIGGPTSSMQ